MPEAVLGVTLVLYVAVLVLGTGLVPNTRIRATAYSLPLPMSLVIVFGDVNISTHQVLGIALLAAFFACGALLARILPPWLAVVLATGFYLAVAALLNLMTIASHLTLAIGFRPSTFLVALVLGGLAWICLLVASSKRHSILTAAAATPLDWTRVLVVVLGTTLAVMLGQYIGAYLVTFPFAGVVVAMDNRRQLGSFATNFALFGVPSLLSFVSVVYVLQSRFSTAICVLCGLAAWSVVTIALMPVRSSWGSRMDIVERVAQEVGSDPGGRGIGHLQSITARRENLEQAAEILGQSQHVAIVTGFPIPTARPIRAETDGPPGAASLAAFLQRLGKAVWLVTDPVSAPVVRAACQAAQLHPSRVVELSNVDEVDTWAQRTDFEAVVFIERPGPTEDGSYRSMSGTEIPNTVPLERLLEGAISIGIGDGGNEVGMGGVLDQVRIAIPLGDQIACVARTDCLIVAGTSNWGALGVLAVTALRHGDWPQELSVEYQRTLIAACVQAGGIDGVHLANEATVDGLSSQRYESVISELHLAVRTI